MLILDEPTVGLDPNQIIEIRNLIKNLGRDRTVILSTHIIPEVVAVCERIVIINDGLIVADDTLDNLMNSGKTKRISVTFEGDSNVAYNVFSAVPGVRDVTAVSLNEFTITSDEDIRREISSAAVQGGLTLLGLSLEESSLEKIFINLTAKGGKA